MRNDAMKKIDICGVGNGITDMVVQVDQALFDTFGLARGSMQLVSSETQKQILDGLKDQKLNLVSGGAVCNSVIIARQLGAEVGFICRLGDDRYGLHYQEELRDLGIQIPNPPIVRALSGTSVIMVTPDGERTMSTCLQASEDLAPEDVTTEIIGDSAWIFTEGYLLGNGQAGQDAVRKSIEIAKAAGSKVAFTFAAPFVVDVFRPLVKELLASVDLVFANHEEANVYAQCDTLEESLSVIEKEVPHVVITHGAQGVYISCDGKRYHVPAVPCTPVDLTGAGDAFAGGYLYGMSQGIDPETAAQGACALAMKVITRIGARIPSGTREFWDSAL